MPNVPTMPMLSGGMLPTNLGGRGAGKKMRLRPAKTIKPGRGGSLGRLYAGMTPRGARTARKPWYVT